MSFPSFASAAGATLHVETLYGVNSHHIAESCFKGLGRALREARLPSTQPLRGACPAQRVRCKMTNATVLIDYGSGNIRSVTKALEHTALALGLEKPIVTSDPEVVARAGRIVLPGQGAFLGLSGWSFWLWMG